MGGEANEKMHDKVLQKNGTLLFTKNKELSNSITFK